MSGAIIPKDVWGQIFTKMDPSCLGSVRRTCKGFKKIIHDHPAVFQTLCQRLVVRNPNGLMPFLKWELPLKVKFLSCFTQKPLRSWYASLDVIKKKIPCAKEMTIPLTSKLKTTSWEMTQFIELLPPNVQIKFDFTRLHKGYIPCANMISMDGLNKSCKKSIPENIDDPDISFGHLIEHILFDLERVDQKMDLERYLRLAIISRNDTNALMIALLQLGANVNHQDNSGFTLLHRC